MLKNIIKTSLRSLVRNSGHNVVNIAGLAIGLATVLLIVVWMNFHRSFDSFHRKSNRIYRVMTNTTGGDGKIQTSAGAIYSVMDEVSESTPQIDDMTRIISTWRWPSELCFKIEQNADCLYGKGIYADSSFFKMFDFEVLKGAENPLSDPNTIAISASLAESLFGDEDPLGQFYKLDSWKEVEIVSVFSDVPKNSSLQFDFIAPLEISLALWGQNLENFKDYSFYTYLTLSPGDKQVVEQAINSASKVADFDGTSFFLQSFADEHLYSNFNDGAPSAGLGTYMKMFGLFALFIFLMSAVNFINLTTAKASIRAKEIGVRKVTGATQKGIMWQFLGETFIRVLASLVLAFLLVDTLLPTLNALIGEPLRLIPDINLVWLVSLMVVGTTLLAGTYPAFVMSRFSPIHALKNIKSLSSGKKSFRTWLTSLQITFSVIIILVTAVVYTQIQFMYDQGMGYDRQGIMRLEPTYQHVKNFQSFRNTLLQSTLITGVGISNSNMLNTTFSSDDVSWPGKAESEKVFIKPVGIDDGMLTTLGIPLLEGTGFNEEDTSQQVILTETAVAVMNLSDPVGAIIHLYGKEARVAGVVADFRTESLHNAMVPTLLHQVKPEEAGTFYIRYDRTRPDEAIRFIEEAYNEHEKFFSMTYSLVDQDFESLYKNESIIARLSTGIMIIALIIALVGLLGLSSYNIIRRYREIGIRKVFGASTAQIIQLLSRDFVLISLIGNIMAWPLAIFISQQWLAGFAYRIQIPYAFFLLGLVGVIFFVLILIILQTYKAASLNPSEVVKEV